MKGHAGRLALLALAVTIGYQTLGSLTLSAAGVVAPVVAPRLGHAPEAVGIFIGLAYFTAMLSGLASGRGVAIFGAVGLSQIALVAFAVALAGITLATLPPFNHGLYLLLMAALIGAGYGVLNPTSAQILDRNTPRGRKALFFSIKQAGVPAGVALAGLVLPAGLLWLDWPLTSLLIAACCLIAAGLIWFARRALEPERGGPPAAQTRPTQTARAAQSAHAAAATAPVPRTSGASLFRRSALYRIFRDPTLRWFVFASFGLSFAQLCFTTFLVSYLNLGLAHSLAASAGVLAASQLVSMGARVFWGMVADRWVAPGSLVGMLGIGAGITMATLGLAARLWPGSVGIPLATLLAILTSITAMSWNGVYMAALAERSQPNELAAITGASQFVTFCGAMVGPVFFAGLIGAGLNWGDAWLAVALLPMLAGMAILVTYGRQAGPDR